MRLRAPTMAFLLAAALASAPALPAASPAQNITVTLSNFRFSPKAIALIQGRAYALTLVNRAGGGHNFVAPEFFSAARIEAADRGRIHGGGVEIPGGDSVTLHFTAPPPGRYKVRCTHTLHSTFGMKGAIVVS